MFFSVNLSYKTTISKYNIIICKCKTSKAEFKIKKQFLKTLKEKFQ